MSIPHGLAIIAGTLVIFGLFAWYSALMAQDCGWRWVGKLWATVLPLTAAVVAGVFLLVWGFSA